MEEVVIILSSLRSGIATAGRLFSDKNGLEFSDSNILTPDFLDHVSLLRWTEVPPVNELALILFEFCIVHFDGIVDFPQIFGFGGPKTTLGCFIFDAEFVNE